MSKKKTPIIAMAIVIVALLVVIGLLINKNQNLKKDAILNSEGLPEFENISEDGYFVLHKEGVAKDFSGKKSLKLEWYTDGLCPDCTRAHTRTEEFLYDKIDNGIIEIKFHILNFLPQHSPEDYPLRLAIWNLGVAEYAPDRIKEFMNIIYQEENPVPLEDRDENYFLDKAKEAEIPQEAIDKIIKNKFVLEAVVNKASVGIRQNKDLIEMSPHERMFVPFIFVSGEKMALQGESEDTDKEIIEPIQKYIDDMKLVPCPEDEEGDSGCN
ncbi:MAG TPA: thioredoxin domain-containing protein [Clostridiaceae bacterium]|nr:thioredoxin domain-containing protein [Clostridiaceae bacterium]